MEHLHKPYLFMPLDPGKGQILWTECRPVLVLNQRFLNNVFTIYLYMRGCVRSTFFNNLFSTYLCMREMSHTAIEDKP